MIGELTEPILSSTAYNKNKESRINVFLDKCQTKISQITFDYPAQFDEFILLIDDFKIICPYTITGEQAWLFIQCTGGIFGAIYSQGMYWQLTCLVSKLTIENDNNPLKDEDKFDLFLDILGKLICSNDESINSQENFILNVKIQIDCFPRNNNNSVIRIVDKKQIVSDCLFKAIQSSSQSK